MDDEYDEEECEELSYSTGARVRPIDWLIVGTSLVRGVAESVTEALGQTEILLCNHANHQVSQMAFQDQARREIESITNSED